MADSFSFQIAGQVLGKLAELAINEIGLIWGVESELNRLEFTLSAIKAVLLDAAEQQVSSRHVRDWLEKLQDALYDVEDVLDDFVTEDLRRKVEIKGSKRKEVRNFFSSSNQLAFRVTMSHKIKKIRKILDDIGTDRRNFQFIERAVDTEVAIRPREQSHSRVRASDVIGRDHDQHNIVQLLLSSGYSNDVSVLPIVGLGGLGKTTLAKLVYNDARIVQNFKTRIWVCVSEDFVLKNLIEKILRAVAGPTNANLDLNELQSCLHNHLKCKKILLVLDDVWNEDPKKWMDLKDLLNCGAEGSNIIVTTRSKTIGKIVGTFPSYDLKGLSNDECLSIFVKCAFRKGEEKEHPNLTEIGKAIASKCGGLPLAVRTLGSLLYTKTEEREWLYIKDNEIWKIAQKDNDVLPILKLSYDQMPTHLKQCFAYCSTFPKDFQIPRDQLINRWIAHGFVQSSDGIRQTEDLGKQYFNDLLSRSFFQDVEVSFDSEVLTCKMHDLMHDLAQSVVGEEFSNVNSGTKVISKRVRHLLFSVENLWEGEFPRLLIKQEKLRSFSFSFEVGVISKAFLDTLVQTFNCLRMLDLSKSKFEELPSSMGTLKHLRYFSLCDNITIKVLPNSISKLLNLQTLDLSSCGALEDLSRDFGNLCSLRHLCLTARITRLPDNGLEGLWSLQHLCITCCNRLESLSMGMQYLTALRVLIISACPSLTSLPESMRYLTSLEKLEITHCAELNLEGKGMEGLRSLQSLAICNLPKLKELPYGLGVADATLKYFRIRDCECLEILPNWLTDCTSLLKLEIVDCLVLKDLPVGIERLTALRFLQVRRCPILIRRYQSTSLYRRWICHIPEVSIDWNDEAAPWASQISASEFGSL